jgi:hypothetical protein
VAEIGPSFLRTYVCGLCYSRPSLLAPLSAAAFSSSSVRKCLYSRAVNHSNHEIIVTSSICLSCEKFKRPRARHTIKQLPWPSCKFDPLDLAAFSEQTLIVHIPSSSRQLTQYQLARRHSVFGYPKTDRYCLSRICFEKMLQVTKTCCQLS